MLAIWACTEGLITWGLYMQVIDVFKAMGLSGVAAVGLWALVGPAQASARFTDLVFGGRYSIFAVALASASLSSLSFLFVLPFGFSLDVHGVVLHLPRRRARSVRGGAATRCR